MPTLADVHQIVEKHWGYSSFRPLQEQAIQCVLDHRDSLLVLPTGGGKSLCYQAPAVAQGGTTVVVSPLIALMKDQVDGLRANNVPAIQLDSSLSLQTRRQYKADLLNGSIRLVFVSPERLANEDFREFLKQVGVSTFAIDEAHCISHWGHDFRPEYRQIGRLRDVFPDASFHGYTATATEQVRADICKQLNLKDSAVLVGNFDRPNLSYRILPRVDPYKQVMEVIQRHKGEAGILYALRRADVDDYAAYLKEQGVNCLPYHAGMAPDERRDVQEAFKAEQCDLIVATVAFGMGIDRSNVRYVLHANMPKSIEHYQQETGRAGRDGLEADCVLLYSGGDTMSYKKILTKSAQENVVAPDFLPNALKHLDDMDRYCRSAVCRHRALVQYFGQTFESTNCGACDQCLGDTEPVPDALVLAQKILSGVARVDQRFGIGHVISVLRGENLERVRSLGHDKLTTFGLLREHNKAVLRDWIYQLIGQGVLAQEGAEYPILKLTEGSWQVFRKEREVRLVQPMHVSAEDKPRKSQAAEESWEGVDQGLFDELRELRRVLAQERRVPPYIIFSDATLRVLAQVRPSTKEGMRRLYGIGDQKLQDFGDRILQRIDKYCKANELSFDIPIEAKREKTERKSATISRGKARAYDCFRKQLDVDEIAEQMGRTRGTILGYLADYIEEEDPAAVERYVSKTNIERVTAAAVQNPGGYLKPIFLALDEQVPYEDIRLVVASLNGKK